MIELICEIDGKNYYYNFLENKVIKNSVNKLEWQNIQDFPEMFTKENYTLNIENTRNHLVLSVTEDCNLRCTYCVYHDDRYTSEDWNSADTYMSFKVAKKAIDNFLQNSKMVNNRFISFYGGEPLVNFMLIKKCINYVKDQSGTQDINFSMTTNGLLVRKKIAQFLIEHNVLLNVSIDGAKNIHDRYRVDINNRASFDLIMENLLEIKKNNKDYFQNNITFSSVVAPPVFKEPLLDFLELMPQEVTLNDIDLTHYMNNYMAKNNIQKKFNLDEQIKLEDYPKLLNREKEKIFRVLRILEQGNRYVYSPGGYCKPLIKKTFVSTEGKYFLCEKFHQIENNSYGDVEMDVNVEKIMQLNDRVDIMVNKKCKKCWANRFCDLCYVHLSDNNFKEKCAKVQNENKNILKFIIENNYLEVEY